MAHKEVNPGVEIDKDAAANAGMQKYPTPAIDQIGSEPQNTAYADSVKTKVQTTPALGGDALDMASATDGNSKGDK